MSLLVLVLPTRPRAAEPSAVAAPGRAEYAWVLSPDGMNIGRAGRSIATQLPKADSVAVVVAATDVAWHRISLPKVGAGQMRAALAGLLEDQMLDEADDLVLALAPQAVAGQSTWVAAVNRRWVARCLAEVEAAGHFAERVVPAAVPTQSDDEPASGHFFEPDSRHNAQVWLALSDRQGVQCVALAGALARSLVAPGSPRMPRWTATPAVATQAERWLGQPVTVVSDAEQALAAQRSLWNLRQFDLAPRHRGTRALRNLLASVRGSRWRTVRLGLVALLAIQVVGLNAWAWHQRQTIEDLRRGRNELFLATFPKVRDVLDAGLQMRSETDALRSAAGQVGEADLEPQLAAVARAWPDGRPPAESLRFAAGHLGLPLAGWTAAQRAQFESRLRADGWALQDRGALATLERAGGAGPGAAAGGPP
jgi:general secretion pathway protein L